MRQSRAPTASQQAAGGPPPSSRIHNRLFGGSGLSSALSRRAIQSSGQPEMSKRMALLIKAEKSVLQSQDSAANLRKEAARQLSSWGEKCDDDISDITDKLGVLMYEIGELETNVVDHFDAHRSELKKIRNIEGSVQPCHERKQKILDEIYFLRHKDPQSPKLTTLEQELVRAEAETLVADAQLANITRHEFKKVYNAKLDVLAEYAEKLAIITNHGRQLLDLIDDSPINPGETKSAYDGFETSKQIILDAETELNNWTVDKSILAPTSRLSVSNGEGHGEESIYAPEEAAHQEGQEVQI